MTGTKAVRVSLLPDVVRREGFAEASRFQGESYECLTARRDALFELGDAVLCADGAVKSPVDLTLLPEHRRGHGAMYGGLNHGRSDTTRLRTVLKDCRLDHRADQRKMPAMWSPARPLDGVALLVGLAIEGWRSTALTPRRSRCPRWSTRMGITARMPRLRRWARIARDE